MRISLCALAIVHLGCTDDRGPRLSSVEPAAAGRGVSITLHGERLCGDSGDCATAAGEIVIGLSSPSVKANVIDYTDTSAVISIPEIVGFGVTELVAVVNERSSNALAFEVLAPVLP